MKYLAFDIECCDGRNICEFGYVIASERFEPVARDCFVINPKEKFKLAPYGKQSRISLAFTPEQYYASAPFFAFYERIKSLLCSPEYTVIGFATESDVHFLHVACKRYGLKKLAFEYVDSRKLFVKLEGESNGSSLDKIVEMFGIPRETAHKSDDDALATLDLTRMLCERSGKSFDELTAQFPEVKNNSKNIILKEKKPPAKKSDGTNVKADAAVSPKPPHKRYFPRRRKKRASMSNK